MIGRNFPLSVFPRYWIISFVTPGSALDTVMLCCFRIARSPIMVRIPELVSVSMAPRRAVPSLPVGPSIRVDCFNVTSSFLNEHIWPFPSQYITETFHETSFSAAFTAIFGPNYLLVPVRHTGSTARRLFDAKTKVLGKNCRL